MAYHPTSLTGTGGSYSARGMLTGGAMWSARPLSARPFKDSLQGLHYTSGLSKNSGYDAWDEYVKRQNQRNVEKLMHFTMQNADSVASDPNERSYGSSGGFGSPRSPRYANSIIHSPRAMSPRQMMQQQRAQSARLGSPRRHMPLPAGIVPPTPPLTPRGYDDPNAPRLRPQSAHRPFKHGPPGFTVFDAVKPPNVRKSDKKKKQKKQVVTQVAANVRSRFADLESAFKEADADGSGKVSKEEVVKMMALWNIKNPGMSLGLEADVLIEACDMDGDGTIDFNEFVQGLESGKHIDLAERAGLRGKRGMRRGNFGDPLGDPLACLRPGVSPEELANGYAEMRDRLLHRHESIHKAFKFMDKDGSGFISRKEFEESMRQLGVNLRKEVIDSLLDIIDVEDDDDAGDPNQDDHDIGFREFARVMTAADIFKMKMLEPRPKSLEMSAKEKTAIEYAKHLRSGVKAEELRSFQELIKKKMETRYKSQTYTMTFKWIDADRTGSINRQEFKDAMVSLNLETREVVMDNLYDFMDVEKKDGTGYRDFSRVLSSEDVMAEAKLIKS